MVIEKLDRYNYIIVSRKLMGSVRNSRAFPSADVESDHQLVMVNIKLKLKTRKATERSKRINIDALKNEAVRESYQNRINQKWEAMMDERVEGIEEEWNKVKSVIQETSEEILGYKKGLAHAEWQSKTTLELMEERRIYKSKRRESADMAKHHNYLCRMVKRSAR